MPQENFDLIVIGGGPGGYVASIRAAQLGSRVACVEKESALGGTCLRIGCIPSKALLESSDHFEQATHSFGKHGIELKGLGLNLYQMMARKDQIVRNLTQGVDALFVKHKIARFKGTAQIAGRGKVVVENGQDTLELNARHILIATGSKPSVPAAFELHPPRVGTSTDALAYPEVPDHLVVIGGGYIGMELGSVWKRLGSRVTVLEFTNNILGSLDEEISSEAFKLFQQQGIEFRVSTKVIGIRIEGDLCHVDCEPGPPVTGDKVLVAVGRVPNTERLGLEEVGIETDSRGFIKVNQQFQTSVEGIHAIGDVIGGLMLAHKAQEEGIACAEMLAGHYSRVDYEHIPAVVYTNPEIATVGFTEEELVRKEIRYRKGVLPFLANGRAHTLGQTSGKLKIISDASTDRVLGVHIIGPRAGDLIGEATAAMAFGASSEDIARVCHAHPTLSEAMKEAAMAVEGNSIHFFARHGSRKTSTATLPATITADSET